MDKGNTDSLGTYNYLNGILGKLDRAGLELGPVHLDKNKLGIDDDIDSFVLIHNNTDGIIKDGAHTFRNKFAGVFGANKEAKQLSALLNESQQSGRQINIVAHSEGTAIFTAAVKDHNKTRGTSLSNIRIRFHGPAVNVSLASKHFEKAGIKFFGSNGGVDINSSDAVPNIIGGNTLNPLNIIKSLFKAPTLTGKIGTSPHTFPVGCDASGCKE